MKPHFVSRWGQSPRGNRSTLRWHKAGVEFLEDRRLLSGLTLVVNDPRSIFENAGPSATTATVTRGGADTSQPLTVALASSDTNEATVPASVTIFAGQDSATFSIDAVDDAVLDGPQTVTIIASSTFPGNLGTDGTFGQLGRANQTFGTEALALQPDGKVVAAGFHFTGVSSDYYDFGIARHTASGAIDTSFNGTGTKFDDLTGRSDQAQAIAVQPDGKILVGGKWAYPATSTVWGFALARYLPNGLRDPSFGAGGVVTLTPASGSAEISDVHVLPDGKILAGGGAADGFQSAYQVARFTESGSLDTTFGTSGIASASGGFGTAMAVQSDGRIVLAGLTGPGNSNATIGVARFTASGQLDASLDSDGRAVANLPGYFDYARDVALQPDGKIVVAGYSSPTSSSTVFNFVLTRFNANGSLDTTFGDGGFAVKDFGGDDQAWAVAISPDGKILAAGQATAIQSSTVARFQPNGTFETYVSSATGNTRADDIAVGADGRVFTGSWYTYSFPAEPGFVTAYTNTSVLTASDTVTVLDYEVNQAPTASDDQYQVNEDTLLNVAIPGVLGNDSDPENDMLEAVLVAKPSHGTLNLNANGSFKYLPARNYSGTDTFAYKANDGTQDSNSATVTIVVSPVNDPPGSLPDAYSIDEDATLTVAAPGVLANDGDVEGDSITSALVSGPSHGSLDFRTDGSFTYDPAADFNGEDVFTYRVNDGHVDGMTAIVKITVTPVNDAPVANDDSFLVEEDQVLSIPVQGVTSLWMKSDPGDWVGQGLTYSIDASTGQFTANRNYDQGVSLSYTGGNEWWYLDFSAPEDAVLAPGPYLGAARWPFQAATEPGLDIRGDGRGSSTLTGGFTIHQADYAADGSVVSFAATFEQHTDGQLPALRGTIRYNDTRQSLSGVLANDNDIDGDVLSAVLTSPPAHGTLAFNPNGTFTYSPDVNWNGTDTFKYLASDGQANSSEATVTITVTPVNDAPVAESQSVSTAEDTAKAITLAGSDVDGSALTYEVVTLPGHGTLSGTAPNLTYTPAAHFNGVDSFTFKVSDVAVDSSVAMVGITVTPVNDAPVVTVSGPAVAPRGQSCLFTFAASDPVDGNPIDQQFSYSITWDDGTIQTEVGGYKLQVGHVFANVRPSGTYVVTATVTDEAGSGMTSDRASSPVEIFGAEIQGGDLVVVGTAASDSIQIKPADANGNLAVFIAGQSQGVFRPTGWINVYALAGDDLVQVQSVKIGKKTASVTVPAAIFGAEGNETIDVSGSNASNILVGGSGNDAITSSSGRDLLFGGMGADTLRGGSGEDILVAGTSAYDSNLIALRAIWDEWTRTDATYSTRVGHLKGTVAGGRNAERYLTASTVSDDAAADRLFGESDTDWFFYCSSGNMKDSLDRKRGEEVTLIAPRLLAIQTIRGLRGVKRL